MHRIKTWTCSLTSAGGTRTPSSVELGCAYDGTLVPQNPGDPNSPLTPKSFATVGGACTLPTALSGDPFLPQIAADSFEFGLRGKLFDNLEWNTAFTEPILIMTFISWALRPTGVSSTLSARRVGKVLNSVFPARRA